MRCDDQGLRGESLPNGVQVIHDGQVHYDGLAVHDGLVPQHDAQVHCDGLIQCDAEIGDG